MKKPFQPILHPYTVRRRPDELIDLAALRAAPDVEVIRRYSGGGTVIVDHNTIFTSIIMNGAQAGESRAAVTGPSGSFVRPAWTSTFKHEVPRSFTS